jgi:hypothetical protein
VMHLVCGSPTSIVFHILTYASCHALKEQNNGVALHFSVIKYTPFIMKSQLSL